MTRRPRPPGTKLYTVHALMDRAALLDEATVNAARAELLAELTRWADACGYTRAQTRESLTTTGLSVTGMMVPRTDGEWPAIHQAIREDELDLARVEHSTDPF